MSEKNITATIANRYRMIEKVGQGGMGAVYRAEDRLTGHLVALKRVELPMRHLHLKHSVNATTSASAQDTRQLSPGMDVNQIALMNEFRILAALRHPNIVSVLDYGLEGGYTPFFTMELLHEPQDISKALFAEHSLQFKVQMLVELLQALIYLHRHHIIHADLKPSNVLVDRENHVRVLDFGLSVQASYARATSGSIPYMAPEVLQGEPITEAADLYAFGLIAYECFTGSYPFDFLDQQFLIDQIINAPPDRLLIERKANRAIADILLRLLAKKPLDRYHNAYQVIQVLCQAVGLPVPDENPLVRESLLQSARFVGRRDQLTLLEDALQRAVLGKGSAWLIGGESGVGKSRLLEEVRIRALVNGVIVVRGQGIREGGLPMQLWHDVLPTVLLSAEVSAEEASILKPVVPTISYLLKYDVDDAPNLDPQAAHERLVTAIVALFQRTATPIVLLLDDLQWAEASLDPLHLLVQSIELIPLFIIGAYRSDDAPQFPTKLPDMLPMMLERLSEDEVGELSAAILGDVEQHHQVVNFLQKETEGNALFLVEALRTLAEDAGTLNQIGNRGLPAHVFPASIREAITRRLGRLPESYLRVLQFAAVAGRQIDLRLLKHITPDVNFDDWLPRCTDSAIIEIAYGRWRFTHDKIRDGVLLNVNAQLYPFLHWRVAEAKEVIYYTNRDDLATSLAEHWHIAGNLEREAYYVIIEGKRLINISAFTEALSLLEATDEQLKQASGHWAEIYRLQVQMLIGEAYLNLDQYTQAQPRYEDSLVMARQQKHVQATADSLVGLARITNGLRADSESSQRLLEEAITAYEAINYQAGVAQALFHLGGNALARGDMDAARTYYERCLRIHYESRNEQGIGNSLGKLGQVAYQEQKYLLARQCLEEALVINQRLSNRRALAHNLLMLGNLALLNHNLVLAETRFREGLNVAQSIDDLDIMSAQINYLTRIYEMQGRLKDVIALYEQTVELARRRNLPTELATNLGKLGYHQAYSGDKQQALLNLREWATLIDADAPGAMQFGLLGWIEVMIHVKRYAEAAEGIGLYTANAPDQYNAIIARQQHLCINALGEPKTQTIIARGSQISLSDMLKRIQQALAAM
ncbi:MAG: protein kinase [Anaerolineae bacterium]|nr:protein kinase [Anaerolineae bacterium]